MMRHIAAKSEFLAMTTAVLFVILLIHLVTPTQAQPSATVTRGRVINLLPAPVLLGPLAHHQTELVDTSDCRTLAAFHNEEGTALARLEIHLAVTPVPGRFPDRVSLVQQDGAWFPGTAGEDRFGQTITSDTVSAPFAGLFVRNPASHDVTLSGAWLYCAR